MELKKIDFGPEMQKYVGKHVIVFLESNGENLHGTLLKVEDDGGFSIKTEDGIIDGWPAAYLMVQE